MGVLFRLPTGRATADSDGSSALNPLPPISPFAPPANARRSLTAAATQVKIKDPTAVIAMRERMASTAGWQNDAFAAYENVGEINYAFNLVANLLSRIRLYVGAITDLARPPAPVSEVPDLTPGLAVAAQAALDRIARGSDYGLPGMLYDLAVNLSVPGECYLVQIPEVPDIFNPGGAVPESWSIRSIDEVVVTQDNQVSLRADRSVSITSSTGLQKLPSDAYVGRIFRSSPRFSGEPASSMKAVLPQVDELYLLNQMFRGTILSRLNSGLLYIPDGLTASHSAASAPVGPPVPGDPTPAPSEEDEFELDLIDAMMTPISDPNSAASVVPLVVRGPSDLGEKIKHIKFERAYDEHLVARADAVMNRILEGIDLPKDVVSGLANVKYAVKCDNHQMLTRTGWKLYNEVSLGDEILTLNHETGMSEWQPLLAVNVHDVDPGEQLLHMDSRSHHSVSTATHRWPIVKIGRKVAGSPRRWTTSIDGFTSTDRIETAVPYAEAPTDAKYTDDFVRLVALYTSDSTPPQQSPRAYRRWVTIGKVKSAEIVAVRALLTRLFGSAATGRNAGTAAWTERVGVPSELTGSVATVFWLNEEIVAELGAVAPGHDRVTTEQFILALTSAQLELFLHSLLDIGDGVRVSSTATGDVWRFWQMREDRLRAIELAAILSGRTARRVTPVEAGTTALGVRHKGLHGLTVSSARTTFQPYERHTAHTWVTPPDGTKVFCPTTANHTWLAKCEGTVFYTGNSNAIVIEETLLRSHIEPLALLICDALTRAYLRPYLTSSAFTAAQAERITLWFDPIDITARPSHADEATEGFDRYALSYSAWRRAHGFDESAAPGPNEIVQRMMVNKGAFTPELTETLLKVIAPLMMEDARQTSAAASDNPLPSEVQQALGLPPSQVTPPPPPPGEPPPPPASAPAEPAPATAPASGPVPPPPAPAGATP